MSEKATISVDGIKELVTGLVEGLRAPTVEEKQIADRKRRERQDLMREQMESIERQKAMQDNCPHIRSTVDGKSHSTITAVHNYPDGIVRGVCMMCQMQIEPDSKHYQQVQISHALALQQT